ncbi:hypothetical protein ACF0H5_023290 [Mactra antiquata]
MALFWLIKGIFFVGLICKLSLAFSVEPKYTKFQFEEQLLEKLIRFEMYIEKLEKDNKILIANSMATINTTKYEMDKELNNFVESKSEIQKLLADNLNKANEMNTAFADNLKNTKQEIQKELDTITGEQTSIKDDINGLTGQIDQISSYVAERKTNKDNTTIVFNVYADSPQTRSKSEPIIFDHIRQNKGDGYNASTGIFTAPVAGIYQFNGHLCTNKAGDLEYAIYASNVYIVKGEFRAASDSDDEKCTSFGASHYVQTGEDVSVRGYRVGLDAGGDDLLSFSGALIKAL